MVRKLLTKLIPIYIKKELVNFSILANEYGQYKTIKKWDCIAKDGSKIPWYTYPAIEYLNNIDFSNKTIFEYGSGNSSAYWSNKSRTVISIESDEEWYEKVKGDLNSNQKLLLCSNDIKYENVIKNKNKILMLLLLMV